MNDYKHLAFLELGSLTKTKKFKVVNKLTFFKLGEIKWYFPWRKYCFIIDSPGLGLVFDAGCLADIQDFINKLMAERLKEAE